MHNGVGHPGLELGFTLYLSKCGLLNHVCAGMRASLILGQEHGPRDQEVDTQADKGYTTGQQ